MPLPPPDPLPETASVLDGGAVLAAPLLASSWTISGQTTVKPVNDCFKNNGQLLWRNNEDRFHFAETDKRLLTAVADGAGSSGMFCGAWAEELVKRLPETPIAGVDDLNRWIDGFWQEFSDKHKNNAVAGSTRLSKFVREGSCATLVACWLEKQDNRLIMHWVGYGDSPLYVFERNDDNKVTLGTCFPSTLGAMERAPHLLNWKDLPDEGHLHTGTVDLHGQATVLLASDGIGQFIMLRYLVDLYTNNDAGVSLAVNGLLGEFRQMVRTGSSGLAEMARRHLDVSSLGFANELDVFAESLQTEQTFIKMVQNHHNEGLMPNDDATLVMINIAGGGQNHDIPDY